MGEIVHVLVSAGELRELMSKAPVGTAVPLATIPAGAEVIGPDPTDLLARLSQVGDTALLPVVSYSVGGGPSVSMEIAQ